MNSIWDMDAAIQSSHDLGKEAGVFAELKSAEMWQCPTLAVHRASANWGDPKFRADPRVKYIPRRLLAGLWKMENWSKEDLAWERRRFSKLLSLAGRMHAAGVHIVAGTDVYNPYTFPGFSLHDELELFVQAGMTATDALATATINPARFLGEEKARGAIKPGMVADLVLLDANPLQNIGNTKRINCVIQRGKLYNRPDLDLILKACERLAAKRVGKPKAKE
ncbi:MAG: amidohydrolase family protein [Armatimonadota bacterium]|nr:amidohydrolase family protein [Armatimonadota bacterium]